MVSTHTYRGQRELRTHWTLQALKARVTILEFKPVTSKQHQRHFMGTRVFQGTANNIPPKGVGSGLGERLPSWWLPSWGRGRRWLY